ncbi:MAG: conserved membrane protein of unknown function [Promethearchaeota archaeon]|nr:MAG: conserved membrane protein of unknown function [Candidatus Lokiarchaeota archaeon]
MLFQILDIERILQVFIVQGLIMIFFLYISYLIVKRGKKRLNIIFSIAYLCIALGLLINIIYAIVLYEPITTVLAYVTHYFLAIGPVFLLLFNLIVLKSEKIVSKPIQNIMILVYGIIFTSIFFFIPFNGITINSLTNWRSVWTLEFYIYFLTIITLLTTIPNFYSSFRVYFSFENPELEKKWRFFLIGLVGLYSYMYGAFTANYINIPTFRLVMGILGLSIAVFLYLMYYGVGRQLEEEA